MAAARLHLTVKYPERSDSDRPWLPGPPPNRQNRAVEEALLAYRNARNPNLRIQIQHIALVMTGEHGHTNGFLDAFEGPLQPWKGISRSRYLFHGCATKINKHTLDSFSEMGPSITFARRSGYFSREPAVYWSDTIELALAWCVFARTGRWTLSLSALAEFECIIYVTELPTELATRHLTLYSIPCPESTEQEQALVDVSVCSLAFPRLTTIQWCLANGNTEGDKPRLAPPGTVIADWDIIRSRIPKVSPPHTEQYCRSGLIVFLRTHWMASAKLLVAVRIQYLT